MSGGLEVPNHTVRMENGLWSALGDKARKEPEPAWRSRAAVLRAFSQFYLANPASMEAILRDLDDINGMRDFLGRNQQDDG